MTRVRTSRCQPGFRGSGSVRIRRCRSFTIASLVGDGLTRPAPYAMIGSMRLPPPRLSRAMSPARPADRSARRFAPSATLAPLAAIALLVIGCGERSATEPEPEALAPDLRFEAVEGTLTDGALTAIWGGGSTMLAAGTRPRSTVGGPAMVSTLLRSTDGGASWESLDSGTPDDLYSLWSDGSTAVAVGFRNRVVRSTDGGQSWNEVETGASACNCAHLHGVWGRGDEWVAVGHPGLILRSTDRGESWSAVDGGTDATLRAVAGNEDGVLVAVGTGTVLRSTDGGATWGEVLGGSIGLLRAIHVAGPEMIVVGGGQVLRSSDAGASWQAVEGPVAGTVLTGVWRDGAAVVATGYQIGPTWRGIIARSSDGGLGWEVVMRGTDAALFGIAGAGDALTVVGSDGAMLRSPDRGATWESPTPGGSAHLNDVWGTASTAVAVGTWGAVHRTTDGGRSWERAASGTEEHFFSVAGDGARVVAVGHEGAVIHSSDGGATWSRGTVPVEMARLETVRVEGNTAVAAGRTHFSADESLVILSVDGGASWSVVESGTASDITGVWIDGSTLLATGRDGGAGVVLRSRNAGGSWERIETGTAPLTDVRASGDTVFAGTAAGEIVRSVDLGETWEVVESVPWAAFRRIRGHGDALMALHWWGGIYRSVDGGATWRIQEDRPSPGRSLTGIAVLEGNVVLAVGRGGKILRGVP
jgi:photosystem II stability/assembly factor-like uncharacterized protein